MSTGNTLGEHATYEDLVVAILDEGEGAYRIQIIDNQDGKFAFATENGCSRLTP